VVFLGRQCSRRLGPDRRRLAPAPSIAALRLASFRRSVALPNCTDACRGVRLSIRQQGPYFRGPLTMAGSKLAPRGFWNWTARPIPPARREQVCNAEVPVEAKQRRMLGSSIGSFLPIPIVAGLGSPMPPHRKPQAQRSAARLRYARANPALRRCERRSPWGSRWRSSSLEDMNDTFSNRPPIMHRRVHQSGKVKDPAEPQVPG